MLDSAKTWLNAGLSFFYPEWCQLCGRARATSSQSFLCENCRAQVRPIIPPFCERCGKPFEGEILSGFECWNCRGEELFFCRARSAAVARDSLLEIIHRYKYKGAVWFEPFLGELLVRAAAPELRGEQWDCIAPVPLHPTKEREREFNQAERLARRLGRGAGIQVEARLLRRTVQTRTQTLLTREERRENVRNAFALGAGAEVQGRRIILVDDVFTTGATTGACAKVLRRGGAAEVCVWTVGRGV